MSTPAKLMENLSYDPKSYAYSKLLDYLKDVSHEITSVVQGTVLKTENTVSKFYNNVEFKIHLHVANSLFHEQPKSISTDYFEKNIQAMHKAAENIDSYSILLTKAETLRKILPYEVRKYDINLLEQYFHYYSHRRRISFRNEPKVVLFDDSTALCEVGRKVIEFISEGQVIIIASEQVALVAYIFVDMMLNSGFPKEALSLYLVKRSDLNKQIVEQRLTRYRSRCSVVVTESADIDSAVELLAHDTAGASLYRWKVDNVFVQESIYEEFKKRVNMKFEQLEDGLPCGPAGCVAWRHSRKDCDLYLVSENINVDDENAIKMQGFRTTKELLSMLGNARPYSVSLWSDSIAVSNEIAYGVSADLVWINCYAKFDVDAADTESTGAISIDSSVKIPKDVQKRVCEVTSLVKQRLSKWNKLSHAVRVSRLIDIFQPFKQNVNVDRIVNKISGHSELNSQFKIKSNLLCTNRAVPVGIACLVTSEKSVRADLGELILSILDGNAIIVGYINEYSAPEYWNCLLTDELLPLVRCEVPFEGAFLQNHDINFIELDSELFSHKKLRVKKSVWSPIGESFAN